MRLGMSVEFDGKTYDVLELPGEAFVHLIPGLTKGQFEKIDSYFQDFWPEPTIRRRRVLDFAASQCGASIDNVMLYREQIEFDELDLASYVEAKFRQGNRLN